MMVAAAPPVSTRARFQDPGRGKIDVSLDLLRHLFRGITTVGLRFTSPVLTF